MHTARPRVGLLTCVAAQATQPAGVFRLTLVSGIGCFFARQICLRGRAKDLKGIHMLALSLACAGCIWVRMCCTCCICLNVCDCVSCRCAHAHNRMRMYLSAILSCAARISSGHLIFTRDVAADLVGRRSYARSTTSRAIKNNLPLAQAGGDLNATARRAHQIIDTHQRLQKLHKDAEPDRYGINPRGPSGHGTLSGKDGPRGIAWDNAM